MKNDGHVSTPVIQSVLEPSWDSPFRSRHDNKPNPSAACIAITAPSNANIAVPGDFLSACLCARCRCGATSETQMHPD